MLCLYTVHPSIHWLMENESGWKKFLNKLNLTVTLDELETVKSDLSVTLFFGHHASKTNV